MIYKFVCSLSDEVFFVQHKQKFNDKEIENILKGIRFELSHHVNTLDLLDILQKDYGFDLVKEYVI